MKIALLTPTYWPEVRRGTERLVHDLGQTLAARGHDVVVLTTHGGARTRTPEDGMLVDRAYRLPQKGPLRWYEHHVTAAPAAFARLLAEDFDVAHTFFPVEGWAAIRARRWGGPPVVASAHGIMDRPYLVKRRYRLEMIAAAAREAERVSVLSAAAADPYERYLGRRPDVLPGAALTGRYAAETPRAGVPTLICAASLGDPRKRGSLLFDAFGRLRRERPDVRLELVRTPDPVMSTTVEELPPGAQWVDGDDTGELASRYATAWASVLPSVDEAFGLVLVESLAAGTPAVAARSGACPEILDSERVGRLFDADDPAALASAMSEALDLSADPATVAACREHAARFDWSRVVEEYERVYEAAAG
jgi:glycosyltransferase involved in cell wall biosynthesis